MMVQAVESRFGAGTRQLPVPVEWLSENGSIYTSNETREFGLNEQAKSGQSCAGQIRASGRTRTMVVCFEASSVAKPSAVAAPVFVRQERGPHLITWP